MTSPVRMSPKQALQNLANIAPHAQCGRQDHKNLMTSVDVLHAVLVEKHERDVKELKVSDKAAAEKRKRKEKANAKARARRKSAKGKKAKKVSKK